MDISLDIYPYVYITLLLPSWLYRSTYTLMSILSYLYPYGYITRLKGVSAGTQHPGTSAPARHLGTCSAPRHQVGTCSAPSTHFNKGTFATFSTCNRFSIILSAFLSTL